MTLHYVRSPTPDDFNQWRRLHQGYADFYHLALTKNEVQNTWPWLIDAGHVCAGPKSGAISQF